MIEGVRDEKRQKIIAWSYSVFLFSLAIIYEMVICHSISDVKCKEKKTRAGTSVVCFVICECVCACVRFHVSISIILSLHSTLFEPKKKPTRLLILTVHGWMSISYYSREFNLLGSVICLLCMNVVVLFTRFASWMLNLNDWICSF